MGAAYAMAKIVPSHQSASSTGPIVRGVEELVEEVEKEEDERVVDEGEGAAVAPAFAAALAAAVAAAAALRAVCTEAAVYFLSKVPDATFHRQTEPSTLPERRTSPRPRE